MTRPNGSARSLVWDMEDKGHQPCLLTVSLAPLDWWWQTGFGTGLSHHVAVGHRCTVIFRRSTFLISPSKFLVRVLTNVFASLFWVSYGCRLPSCWNNVKTNSICSAGSLVALLLLWVQSFRIPAICLVVLGKYPFGHQFVSLVLLLPFTFPYWPLNNTSGSCEWCKWMIFSLHFLATC